MPLPWACALAAAGFALGPRQRASIFRHVSAARGAPAAGGGPAGGGREARCPRCARPRAGRLWPVLPVTGRCPGCARRIGPPPLTVEAVTGATLAILAAAGPASGWALAALAWLAAFAVPLAFVDVAAHRLPDPLTATAFAGTFTLLAVAALTAGRPGELGRAALGAAALAGLYLALFAVSPEGMGLGDCKLAASLGAALAWFGWSALLAGAFAGFLLGGVYAAALLASRRATRRQQVPFGPFMIAGSFLVLLAGVAGS